MIEINLPPGKKSFELEEALFRADSKNYEYWVMGGNEPLKSGGIVAATKESDIHPDWNKVGPFKTHDDAYWAMTDIGRGRQHMYSYSQPWVCFLDALLTKKKIGCGKYKELMNQ